MTIKNAQDDFVELRCKVCNKFICEVSSDATGNIRRKCEKCKSRIKIRLPITPKTSTISTIGRNAHDI